MNRSNEFRELIRNLERKLGLLNKEGGGYCYNVSLAQCHALVEIGRANSISIKSLSQLLNLDISTMSRTVDNLIAKNYAIKMKSDKDKRIFIVKLTDEGKQLFDAVENKMNNKFEQIFEKIEEEDKEIILYLM
ncbi:MAG: MarR family transcriptional regulator [Clostridium butyricum]|nr:MarR family transcriptional regulator [Clostridium butyricum]